jgi:hypothetical protein
MSNLSKKLAYLGIYAIAMAYLEAVVVVYLRLLYYPQGFNFPLVQVPLTVGLIEMGREFATLVMIFAVAYLTYSKKLHRFYVYMFIFGVWDIFYYVWLWIFLGWPTSLGTWDVLFLLPVPWIGPVWAPMVVSISLILGAIIILGLEESGRKFKAEYWLWILTITAGLIIILSFTLDFKTVIAGTMPKPFKWWLFALGEVLGMSAFLVAWRRSLKNKDG